jgi:hypothetical protein
MPSRDFAQFPADENGDVLWHMRSKGDALSEPREVDVSAVFPSEEAALDYAVGCLRSSFRVEMLHDDEAKPDGLEWRVVIYTHMVPTHADVCSLEDALRKHAVRHEGRVDGWSATLLKNA